MGNEFDVIGERKDDEQHLLVVGDDGQHYDYSLTSEQVSPVEPDERWLVDGEPGDEADQAEGETDGQQPDQSGDTPAG
jgi:hypothetical protein